MRHWMAKPMHGISVLWRDGDFLAEERVPCGDEDLRAHQVDAGDALGDRVLHLDARVHLDEEPVVLVHVIEELDGAGVVVADALGQRDGGVAKLLADDRIEIHGRGDLDDFLIAALHRAVALVKVDDVAVLVAEDLHLDVLGAGNVALQEHGGVAEGVERLVLRLGQQPASCEGFSTTRMPRPPPPKAALMMSGKPISWATVSAWSGSVIGSSVPGRVGTLNLWASARAAVLSPMFSSRSGDGPMKVMPSRAQARANAAFSDRNP